MRFLFVCHVGSKVGLGHLARLKQAGRASRDRLGADCFFLTQGDDRVDPKYLREFEHNHITNEQNLFDIEPSKGLLLASDIIVFDLFAKLIPANFGEHLAHLRARGIKLVAVDGLIEFGNVLDLIFIPSFRCPVADLGAWGTRIVFGWDCFLLNVNVLNKQWHSGNRVLALTGGSDLTGLGQVWPGLLNEHLPPDSELDWITGPFSQAPLWPDKHRIGMVKHVAPESLTDLMANANYALSVYGVSFFELLGYGVPTVVFSPYGGKDDRELAEIADAGLAIVANDETTAVDLLVRLMTDDALATSLSEQARSRRLHAGHERFASEMRALLE